MFYQQRGKPPPLERVILLSMATLGIYGGWYKRIIQEELRRHSTYEWSGTLCLLPFVLGVAIPQALWILNPDVPRWFGWGFLLDVFWIYIVQFRLYRTVNALYGRGRLQKITEGNVLSCTGLKFAC